MFRSIAYLYRDYIPKALFQPEYENCMARSFAGASMKICDTDGSHCRGGQRANNEAHESRFSTPLNAFEIGVASD